MKLSMSNRAVISCVVAFFSFSAICQAQVQIYPAFSPTPVVPYPGLLAEGGVNSLAVPNAYYGQVLMSVFADPGTNLLTFNLSTNGQNSVTPGQARYIPQINCQATTPSTCAAAIRMFNNKIYIAYSEGGTGVLDVFVATPSGTGYTLASVYHDSTNVKMITAPEMEVVAGKLVIVYGSSNDTYTKHAFYSVTYNGVGWTAPSERYLGGSGLRISSTSKPGMAYLNGTLWMCTQQNNSNHQLFTYYTTDGVTWNFGTQFSALALGGGASMVSYKGALILANLQNNSNRSLYVFSSTDGYHWGALQYPSIRMGNDPGLALFNGGYGLAFRANDSSADLYTDFATH